MDAVDPNLSSIQPPSDQRAERPKWPVRMLIARVGSQRCRLILDCNAMSSEGVPAPELVRRHRSLLAHFHANDPNGMGPGFGKLDFVPIFRALREIAYRGWISVEVFEYEPGPERLARESIAYMKRCL